MTSESAYGVSMHLLMIYFLTLHITSLQCKLNDLRNDQITLKPSGVAPPKPEPTGPRALRSSKRVSLLVDPSVPESPKKKRSWDEFGSDQEVVRDANGLAETHMQMDYVIFRLLLPTERPHPTLLNIRQPG